MKRAPRSLRCYRLLLRAFPSDFRREFGEDMAGLLEDRLNEAGRSRTGRLRVWVGALADVALHAPLEWMAHLAGSGGGGPADAWLQDLRQALRSLRRSPGFAALAVGTLALGIGANAAVFSVVNAVLLRPLPYHEPDRLVTVWPQVTFNTAMVGRVGEAVVALEDVSGVTNWTYVLTGDGEPEELMVSRVTANHLDVLGVRPALGRGFRPEDGIPGRNDVVILGHDVWRNRFAADPAVVGRTVDLAGGDHTRHRIVGVMGEGFRPVSFGGDAPQAWTPLPVDPSLSLSEDNTLYINWRVGRLTEGATAELATEQLRGVAGELSRAGWNQFAEDDVRGATVEPLHAHQVADVSATLWILLGVVGLVLLMACANVANLLLARGEARERDLAVRVAMGAGRGRLARQLLAESLLLGTAGALGGVALAAAAVDQLARRAPPTLPRGGDVGVDGAVLAFAAGAALLASVLFGTAPAFRAAGRGTAAAIRGGGRGSLGGHQGVSRWLVGAEIALAVVVVAASGLMLRSLAALYDVDPGFRAEGLVVFRPLPPPSRYPDAPAYREYYRQVMDRVGALPGVTAVGGIQLLPTTYGNWSFPTHLEDHPVVEGEAPPSINFRVVTPGYVEVMGIPLVAGRTLNAGDDAGAEAVAVVNRTLAERYWPGGDALGKELRFFSPTAEPVRVVGVVGDVRQHGLDRDVRPELYLTPEQYRWGAVSFWIVARTAEAPEPLLPLVREAVWEVDPDAPVSSLDTMERVVARSAGNRRLVTALLAGFGLVALALGVVGVYGVTAYTVARRTPEFGVRLALGASRARVLRSAMVQGMAPVALGVVAGVAGAAMASGLLSSLLWEVPPRDPLTLGSVAGFLGAVAALATALPAWRAIRVDPTRVLRSE
ncbi:MAG: ABC transporter permease [Gemmatimonadetes bacterium]|nr:ABC transporter permease [Gemmatimonadota bacterium]